jgi:hypothetical protein
LTKDQDKADGPAEVGAHQGDEGGHAYYRTNGKSKRELKEQHAQGTQRSKNQRFQKLAGEKL